MSDIDMTNLPYSAMPKEPRDETAWVLESAGPKYWDGRGLRPENFTKKHEDAIRFSRKEDAETIRCWLLDPLHRLLASREHMWLKKP